MQIHIALILLFRCIKSTPGYLISDKKCAEYGNAVYALQDSPILSRKSLIQKVSLCGIVSVPLIIGGKEAHETEFPHMALIGFGHGNNTQYNCGGSLISETFILTAAHCVDIRATGPVTMVKVGMMNKESTVDVQVALIQQVFKHPNYKRPSKYNDIALLQLEKPVQFNANVRPACLNTNKVIVDKKPIATGFGRLTNTGKIEASNTLMKVNIPLISNEDCQPYFVSARKFMLEGVTETMLCAGDLKSGGKDTCQGDSGGPLQEVMEKPYCMYNIVGVTSFGKVCGYAESPAIYTNVYAFVPWIESIVWPNE